MKSCSKCKVSIAGSRTSCPLCQNELNKIDYCEDALFPKLADTKNKLNIILKSIAFTSIATSIISIFLNIILPTDVWWSLYIVTALVGAWISLAIALTKHKKILKYLLYQSVIIILFALFFDLITSWRGWSITFVLPIMFTVAMVVMYTLSKVLNLQTGDYIIYLLLDALFGIIPVIFIGTDAVTTDLPSFICIITSILSLSALIVFEGNNIYNELKRRLHV